MTTPTWSLCCGVRSPTRHPLTPNLLGTPQSQSRCGKTSADRRGLRRAGRGQRQTTGRPTDRAPPPERTLSSDSGRSSSISSRGRCSGNGARPCPGFFFEPTGASVALQPLLLKLLELRRARGHLRVSLCQGPSDRSHPSSAKRSHLSSVGSARHSGVTTVGTDGGSGLAGIARSSAKRSHLTSSLHQLSLPPA